MVKGNTTGGKNYKKSKHSGAVKPAYLERAEDQMYARVIRTMGNRNVQCFCNDLRTRLCHIRGVMRNRVWINVGDYVLISIRGLASEENKETEKADILAKYDADHLHKLKNEPDINSKLFLPIEGIDGKATVEEEGAFEFDEEEKPVDDSDAEVDVDAI
jgi:translation initiation factor 1A